MQKQNDENNLTQNYMFIVSLIMDVGIRYTSCIIYIICYSERFVTKLYSILL
jgi:hypothetical protein